MVAFFLLLSQAQDGSISTADMPCAGTRLVTYTAFCDFLALNFTMMPSSARVYLLVDDYMHVWASQLRFR